jgi:hypothetical protein
MMNDPTELVGAFQDKATAGARFDQRFNSLFQGAHFIDSQAYFRLAIE